MFGVPVAEMPGALMPLTLWGLPTITGILNWNTDQTINLIKYNKPQIRKSFCLMMIRLC